MTARARSVLVVVGAWAGAVVAATLGIAVDAAARPAIAQGSTAHGWGAYAARAFAWVAVYAPGVVAVVVTRRRLVKSIEAGAPRPALTARTERLVRMVRRACDLAGVVVAGTVAFDVLVYPLALSTALKPRGASWRVGFRLMDGVMPSAPAFAIVAVIATLLLSAMGAASLALAKRDVAPLRRALATSFFAAACAVLLIASQWRGGDAAGWSMEAPALFVSALAPFGVSPRVLAFLGLVAMALVAIAAGAAWLALSDAEPPDVPPPSADDIAAADLDVE